MQYREEYDPPETPKQTSDRQADYQELTRHFGEKTLFDDGPEIPNISKSEIDRYNQEIEARSRWMRQVWPKFHEAFTEYIVNNGPKPLLPRYPEHEITFQSTSKPKTTRIQSGSGVFQADK